MLDRQFVAGVDDASAAAGEWLGLGARVLVVGSPYAGCALVCACIPSRSVQKEKELLAGTKARITGLQKNALYVVRVIAVSVNV
jgi:hypothetical protein